jgi:glucose/arabinose dehydrogenase
LLGIALHPEFPDQPSLYVYQTYRDDGLHNRILRYRWTADQGLERPGAVLDDIPGGSIHDGGRIAFGPDGKLYATTGDASQGDLAQNRNSLAGKLLRLNPDGSIPSDNPFADSPVWSYGHRNLEGLAWHPDSQQLYATEHGSSGHDEVNRIEPGNNYGWPEVAGKTGGSQFTDPVLESGTNTWAPSGAAVYSGDAFPAWQRNLFFTTLGFSPGDGRRSLHRIAFESAEGRTIATHEVMLTNQFGRLRAVTEGPDGTIYLATSNQDGRGEPAPTDDRILRLQPTN